ncbi:integrase [Pseudoxanthomonas winnipegensis]|uniref:Integrase n=2 Tax=Pseudoxanthomonas winnipegensis TaxID=2480810 RepID=A0ABY1WCY8_9GAMM|nr:tyrosine-type recombinase/integrase [Pseudoxanthomonas winnipegensis]TAA12420.1 integrase [Pseudoxanthomonas winnipegensis]TAA19214.1 integrase [Pseudoxanthomonas winnipegensis]TAH70475.1 integrase [Pseudoxanthomonas winnipegensis]
MMGRTRSKARAGWPANLYPNRDGYKYRHPATRKETWMGRDKAKAFAAARQLNALLEQSVDLVAKVAGAGATVADAIDVFLKDDVPARNWAPKTAENYTSVINRIRKGFGAMSLDTLSVKDCATFIREVTESERGRQQFRLVLGWILACAVEEGWIDTNPALVTRKFHHARKRERLTKETYRAIHAAAPAWVRLAMDISLMTLLRREDVVLLKFSDQRDGHLWVVPAKTEGSTGLRLKIAVDPDLAAMISAARDAVVSPYVVHRLPEKARPSDKRAKDRAHHTQVLPEQLSRAFAVARDAARAAGADIPEDHPPTFHEIRSLGGALLRSEKGWTEKQVQALMGHSSEAMTRVYLDGHEVPWSEVSTGAVRIS